MVVLASASRITSMADLPPSSKVQRFRFDPALAAMICPTSVEPVNAIFSMPG
jgi:hypothetical protein